MGSLLGGRRSASVLVLVEIIRACVRRHTWEAATADLGPGADDLARLVPAPRRRIGGTSVRGVPGEADARFRLFDSVATLLRQAGRRQALLLIVDDLHWADESSLQLLRFLSREIGDARVLVLGTLRSPTAGPVDPLAALSKDSRCIVLRELSANEVGSFVHAATGATPTADLVAILHRETAGNPFFVRELVAAGADGLASAPVTSPQRAGDHPPPPAAGVAGVSRRPVRRVGHRQRVRRDARASRAGS